MEKIELWKKDRKIAYFSMEIGHDLKMPNYAGGLGILAGDTLKSCADLSVPIVAVTLLSEEGYFKQEIDPKGNQIEHPEQWNKKKLLTPLSDKVVVTISGRDVIVKGWMYRLMGLAGFEVPVIYLDTDLPENSKQDRQITKKLYQGDKAMRISQEIVLGIAGFKLLESVGFTGIERYHLNEGHGSFLILEMLSNTRIHTHKKKDIRQKYDFKGVREKIVFTTHTPIAAGHDKFSPKLVKRILGDNVEHELVDYMVKDRYFNMTHVALANSKYVNGVAKKHAEVTRKMFPEHLIGSITNGVHTGTWVCPPIKRVFDKYVKDWFWDPESLRFAKLIPKKELWRAHVKAKEELLKYINSVCGCAMSQDVFTIGFARRVAPYKRLTLMFSDLKRLKGISDTVGKIQIIMAGKAHPADDKGKALIKKVYEIQKKLAGDITITFIPNYDLNVAKKMVAGVDMWLNTPQRPKEASGTSGMKAAHNGVPQMSTLDGWWIEGCLEDVTGWSIGGLSEKSKMGEDSREFYSKLEQIVSKFYEDRDFWTEVMRNAIAFNASHFNTHRMVKEYVTQAYFE